jgi:hypothetical protein
MSGCDRRRNGARECALSVFGRRFMNNQLRPRRETTYPRPRPDHAPEPAIHVRYGHTLRERHEKIQAQVPDRFSEMMERLWASHQPERDHDS